MLNQFMILIAAVSFVIGTHFEWLPDSLRLWKIKEGKKRGLLDDICGVSFWFAMGFLILYNIFGLNVLACLLIAFFLSLASHYALTCFLERALK